MHGREQIKKKQQQETLLIKSIFQIHNSFKIAVTQSET